MGSEYDGGVGVLSQCADYRPNVTSSLKIMHVYDRTTASYLLVATHNRINACRRFIEDNQRILSEERRGYGNLSTLATTETHINYTHVFLFCLLDDFQDL